MREKNLYIDFKKFTKIMFLPMNHLYYYGRDRDGLQKNQEWKR